MRFMLGIIWASSREALGLEGTYLARIRLYDSRNAPCLVIGYVKRARNAIGSTGLSNFGFLGYDPDGKSNGLLRTI